MDRESPGLADRATLDAMADYVRAHLVKTVALGSGETFSAVSETAVRFNDSSWFWTDDNAKAAELLCEPALYDAAPGAADAAIDFVLRMSGGDVIQRRWGAEELRVLSADPAAFRVETAFVIIEGDLTRGVVRHAMRFNDNRTVTAVEHAGHMVSFRQGWRSQAVDLGAAITGTSVVVEGGAVRLSHTSALRQGSLWPGGVGAVLGEVRCTYTVRSDRPSVGMAVEVVPSAGVVLEDVEIGTSLSRLGHVPDVHYRAVAVRVGGVDRVVRDIKGKAALLHAGAADYVAVVQEGASPGFSYAVHCLLPDGARLGRVVGREHKRRRLGRVRLGYRMGRVAGEAGVREERMVTGGGYYDALAHYAGVMREGLGGGHSDPSMSYDIGAELNAVAVHILFARRGRYAAGPSAARVAALTAWYDRHLARYFAFIRPDAADALDRVFTRGIAYVVLSLDCMVRATGEARYRALLATGVELILRKQRRQAPDPLDVQVTFGDGWAGELPFLDNHSACVLALARAAWHGDPGGVLGRAVHEGIRGVRLFSGVMDVGGGHRVPYDGLAVVNAPGGRAHSDPGFWNYKIGVTLRALHAAMAAADAGVIGATEEERVQAGVRIGVAERLLAGSMRRHGEMLEVLTSRIAGETNSETQPWVALGLAPVLDAAIVGLGPIAAA